MEFKTARIARGWSQYRAAAEIGISQPTVCKAEKGRSISKEVARLIVAAMPEVDWHSLLYPSATSSSPSHIVDASPGSASHTDRDN